MKVPLSWLREYVEINEPVRQVADRLTFAGIEVEAIHTIGSACDGIVVGEVRDVQKHPNADKLTVCRVFDGRQELQVVCGAPNVKAGGKYPFAPAGVTMPDGTLKIKAARLRGVESSGMLCSEVELLLSEDHSGLMTLDPKWAAGTPLAAVIGPPDTVFELEITPNRPDLLSLIGIARELAAIYGHALKMPDLGGLHAPALGETLRRDRPKAEFTKHITVEDPDGCPRYTARFLANIRIGPSPDWMQQRLQRAGVRAINNVVDITNYVMLETGQPLHAFDQVLLAGGCVAVRRARAGEKMVTLDGVERDLTPDDLLITDAERPVALAGIMGGAGSEVRGETTSVLLESACFKPTVVRTTSRRLGLSTESSYRFERGVDIGGAEWASRRAAQLMAEFAGALVAEDAIDVYPSPRPARKIVCRFDRVRSLVGVGAPNEEIIRTFRALELNVEDESEESCEVRVPSFRGDLESEVDLVEEFARLHGLDNIPSNAPRAQIDPAADDRPARALADLRTRLVGLGLREICNYSLVSEPLLNLFDPGDAPRRILLPKPITADQSVLRTALIPQMVETLGRNRAHQADEAALFEVGRVFLRDAPEETRLAIGIMGPVGRSGLDIRRAADPEETFLWLKGLWERLAASSRVAGATLREAALPGMDRGCEIVADGKAAGRLGLVKSAIRKEWRLSDPVAVLEVAADILLRSFGRIAQFSAIPAYPSVERDVALVAGEAVRAEEIERIVRAAAPKELESIRLFDIFRGGSIGAGKRSLAYALTYRSAERTLTDEEVNGYHDGVKAALRKQLSVEIRET
jgi:phenylalanyl-tRNA synthetase beta chain